MKRPIALLLVLAAVAASIVPVASAAGTSTTTVRIAFSRAGGGRFSGTVKSPASACVARRRVTVYRKSGNKGTPVGSGSSAANGTWRIVPGGGVAAGSYYAKTPAATRGATTCGAGKSITTRAS